LKRRIKKEKGLPTHPTYFIYPWNPKQTFYCCWPNDVKVFTWSFIVFVFGMVIGCLMFMVIVSACHAQTYFNTVQYLVLMYLFLNITSFGDNLNVLDINGPSCIGNHRSFLWGSTFLNPRSGALRTEINGPSCIGNRRSFLWGSTCLYSLFRLSVSYFCLLAHSPDYFQEFSLPTFFFTPPWAEYCKFFCKTVFWHPGSVF